MSSGAGSSGTGRGRGSSLADNKPENKETKPNPKMSKALGTSAKRYQTFCDLSFIVYIGDSIHL